MAEYADGLLEEMASKVIVDHCELLPKSYHVFYDRVKLHEKRYGIHCGSAVEFYIRPLNPCVTDTDLLVCRTYELAFMEDFPVLPLDVSDLSDTIECYKIDPYPNYPGFVRIRTLGKMYYNWQCKKYEFSRETSPSTYMQMKFYAGEDRINDICRGPAITRYTVEGQPSDDTVNSVWCPQWPNEAQEWPRRRRQYGWPTTATISEIVQHGCHVVYAQHRSCRHDDTQWRLSFSVAEVILLQSWTQIQQIVYHLLRFFAKTEIIEKDCPKEDEVLCPYHLKTLMLWACEVMSPEWWKSSSVIAICCELLKKLSEWLKRRYIPNYFIPKANLFPKPSSSVMLEKIERRLSEHCNRVILCHWFVKKYLMPVTTQTIIKDEYPPAYLFEIRRMLMSKTMDCWQSALRLLSIYNPPCTRGESKTSPSNEYLIRNFELRTRIYVIMQPVSESALRVTCFDRALFGLNAAHGLECGNISWDSELFAEYVKEVSFKENIIRCKFQIFPKTYSAERSQVRFLRALDFMTNLTESDRHSKFQLISLMSKECLRNALECDDSQSNAIAPAALVYLAALHFVTSEYQIVIDLCSVVLMSQTTKMETEIMNAGCLFFIDDVARIVGFCLTWKKFSENEHYNERRIYLDLRITPKVFAQYLTVISAERISKQLELNLDLPTSEFPLDEFFMALATQNSCTSMTSGISGKVAKRCVYRRIASLTAIAPLSANPVILKERLIDALHQCALENMASFYKTIRHDFGIQCNTIDCFRALYLYKCRQYDEALHLCERILKEPELQSNLEELVWANILLMPSLSSFFDDDVQLLLGFHILFYYISHVNDDIQKSNKLAEVGLALFRNYPSKIKLPCYPRRFLSHACRYFLGTHFLARYLKLRCRIDCKCSLLEAMTEFVAMKCKLPFEHIIRMFFEQKLRKF